jgi:thioredoxin 1
MFKKLLNLLGLDAGNRPDSPSTPRETEQSDAAPRPIHVTDQDFEERILGSDKLAVVDFWADWCGPCHRMAPNIEHLAQEYHGRTLVAKMDVDSNPNTPQKFSIMGIPTLIFFANGQEVARQVGVIDFEQLSKQVDQLLAQYPNA